MRKSRQKTLIFRNWISFEPEGVETSSNYVWTAFSQPHKPDWGAKAVRRDLQLQKSRGSRPNFDFFRKRRLFYILRCTALNLDKRPDFFSWNDSYFMYLHFLLYKLCCNISPFGSFSMLKIEKITIFSEIRKFYFIL